VSQAIISLSSKSPEAAVETFVRQIQVLADPFFRIA